MSLPPLDCADAKIVEFTRMKYETSIEMRPDIGIEWIAQILRNGESLGRASNGDGLILYGTIDVVVFNS
jgi:hypothetical protein